MTHHNKRRLAVSSNGNIVGMLEDIDILGLVAGNPQLIPGRIDRARGVDDLARAAGDIQGAGRATAPAGRQGRGDRRNHLRPQSALIAKLFGLTASPTIARSRLPDGNGIGRTRRADRAHRPGQRAAAGRIRCPRPSCRLSATHSPDALERFGFPALSRQRDGAQSAMVAADRGLHPAAQGLGDAPDEESAMNLGIFFDAVTVAGRTELVDRAKIRDDRADARGERLSRPVSPARSTSSRAPAPAC